MKPDDLAARVSADDTRAFSVTLTALKDAYLKAREADIDVVSAMWMNICMDCTPAVSPEVAALIRDAVRQGFAFAAPGEWRIADIRRVAEAIEAAALKGETT